MNIRWNTGVGVVTRELLNRGWGRTVLVHLMSLFLITCHTPQKQFYSELDGGHCEQALEHVPENSQGFKFVNKTKQAAGTVFSYAATGVSYTAEVLWDVVGGTVSIVALCAPAVVLMGTKSVFASSDGSVGVGSPPAGSGSQSLCFPGKINTLGAPPLGRKTYQATKEMRCPDLRSLSQSLRRVADCFEARENVEEKKRAVQVLISIKQSQGFYSCLPREEQDVVNAQLLRLQGQLL